MEAISNTDVSTQKSLPDSTPPSPWAELQDQVSSLKAQANYGEARRRLERARADGVPGATADERTWITQQLALCTYKDEELPVTQRLDTAEELLEGVGLRDPQNKDGETLSLGGAVFKRRWEATGQVEALHESLAFYRAAWERSDRIRRGSTPP